MAMKTNIDGMLYNLSSATSDRRVETVKLV